MKLILSSRFMVSLQLWTHSTQELLILLLFWDILWIVFHVLIVALAVIEGGWFGIWDNQSHYVYLPHRDIEAGTEVYVCSYGGLCTYGIVTGEGDTDLVGAVGGGIRKMLLGVDTRMYSELRAGCPRRAYRWVLRHRKSVTLRTG